MSGRRSHLGTAGALLMALLLAFPPTPAPAAEEPHRGPLEVWFLPPTVKVHPGDSSFSSSPVWDGTTLRLSSARGEHEAFQAVIAVSAAGSAMVTLSPLEGPSTIPADSVEFYKVEYPVVTNTEWPDPLVPLGIPSVVSLIPGRNNPVLVDIFVPAGTSPGEYLANLTVDAGAGPLVTPLALTVWNITLPERTTLQTWFDDSSSSWGSYYKYTPWSSEHQQLMFNVYHQYKKYRISPGNINLGQVGRYNMTVSGGAVSVDFSGTDPWLEYCLEELGFTSFRFPLTGYSPRRADMAPSTGHPDGQYYWGAPPYDMNPTYADHVGQYIKLVADHYRQKGWLDRAYIYVTDEPIAFNDNVTSYWQHPDYHVVRQFYNLTKSQASDLKFVNTVQLVSELFPYTDVWAVPGGSYHELDARERIAAGQTVWWYNVDAGIASPGTEGRALYWDSFSRGVQGVLYWGTNYWDYETDGGNPWNGSNADGDGFLFYPGNDVGIDDDVVPSLRLFLARDGIEDYELLHQYGEICGVEAARAAAESVAVGSAFAGERFRPIEDRLIYDVREWLAGQITRRWDFHSWTETFRDASNLSETTGLEPDPAWEGSFSLGPGYPPALLDSLDSLGGWRPNNQPHIFSSVAIDTSVKTQGSGSLRIDFWRDDDPGELGGYDQMRNGRVITSALALTDWSGYDLLEMDVRSLELPPGNLVMLVGGSGGTVVGSSLHRYSRYRGSPDGNWTHFTIDISGKSRSAVQYIEPIAYNYFLEVPYHRYSYWLDNITLRQAGSQPLGSLESAAIDLGRPVRELVSMDYLSQFELPGGTALSFETRTSEDDLAWSPWSPARPAGNLSLELDSPPGRYFQYRANFASNAGSTLVLSEVRLDYRPLAELPLGLGGLAFEPEVPNENEDLNISVPAHNPDRASALGAVVEILALGGTPPITIGKAVVKISGGGTTLVRMGWKAPAGTYDISARLEPPPGITDLDLSDNEVSATLFINAYPRPAVDAPSWAPVNETVTFDATASWDDEGIIGYFWDFLDGTATGPVVTRSFNSSGDKQYSLSVRDARGAAGSLDGVIRIFNHTPVPSFVISPGSGTVLTTFTFISTTWDPEGAVTNISWAFGDGHRAFGRIVNHSFPDDQSYEVNCTATYQENRTLLQASISRELRILNSPPNADFTATAGPGTNRTIDLDASPSSDPDDELPDSSYAWTFGDGTNGTGKLVSHAYTRAGTFNVTLTLTDDDGARGILTRPVSVLNLLPVADFTAPQNVTCNRSFVLDASPSRDPDGTVLDYRWEFDDGTTASGQTVEHAFALPGQRRVTLMVTDIDGGKAFLNRTIRADPEPSGPPPGPPPVRNAGWEASGVVAGAVILALMITGFLAMAVLSRRRARPRPGPFPAEEAAPPAAPAAETAPQIPTEAGAARPAAGTASQEPRPESVSPLTAPGTADAASEKRVSLLLPVPPVPPAAAPVPEITVPSPAPAPATKPPLHVPPRVVGPILPPPPRIVRVEPPAEKVVAVIDLDDAKVAKVVELPRPPGRMGYSPVVPEGSWRPPPEEPSRGRAESHGPAKKEVILPIPPGEGEADPTLPYNPWATRKK